MQVGDKVKCIDASLSNGILNLRKEYVITYVHFDGVRGRVDNTGDVLWHLDRFELIKEEDVQKKFNPKSEPTKFVPPKPGDKIICNNGEEFICCTLDFLHGKGSFPSKPKAILGFNYNDETWQDWFIDGTCGSHDYNIKEVIPQESSVDSKEPLYTVEEVTEALAKYSILSWLGDRQEGIDKVKDYLSKKHNAEYQEYLRLKAIYE